MPRLNTETEKLFGKELFKFDTKDAVKSTQRKMPPQKIQRSPLEYNSYENALRQLKQQQEQKPRGFGLEVEPLGEYTTAPRSYSF